MSLILNNAPPIQYRPVEHDQDLHDAALLDRYLFIMESNKSSTNFVPNDALVALDMANGIAATLANAPCAPRISTARLALALVQPAIQAALQ